MCRVQTLLHIHRVIGEARLETQVGAYKVALAYFMPMIGQCAFHRVTQGEQNLGFGQVARDALGYRGLGEIRRRDLAARARA